MIKLGIVKDVKSFSICWDLGRADVICKSYSDEYNGDITVEISGTAEYNINVFIADFIKSIKSAGIECVIDYDTLYGELDWYLSNAEDLGYHYSIWV